MSSPTIRVWYAALVSFLAFALIALSGVLYTNHVDQQARHRAEQQQRESDLRWCALLVRLDDAYTTAPPSTQSGRDVAAAIGGLRDELGCPTTLVPPR